MYRPGSDPYTSGDVAPRRIGGGEIEFDAQVPGDRMVYNSEGRLVPLTHDERLLTSENFRRAGIIFLDNGAYWLTNGANFHPDVRRVEYSGNEGDSPEELAAAQLAGVILMKRLAATTNGVRVYYQSGTMIGPDFRTLGKHQNLMTSAAAATQEMADIWDTHQAIRLWAWDGMVGREGFELSQKARGIGHRTSFGVGHRTTEGAKPMGWMKVGDTDVFRRLPERRRYLEMTRAEGRVVDPTLSRWSAYEQEAIGSLALRIPERRDVFDRYHPLSSLRLADPVRALHTTSRDLTLQATHLALDGKYYTAIDLNEMFAEYGDYLRQRVELPEGEHRAVDELFRICDDLRRIDILDGYVTPVMDRIGWAPRLAYLAKNFAIPNIHSSNRDAVSHSLAWSRVYPDGPGSKYWDAVYAKGKAPDPVGDELIEDRAVNPCPTTRANIRGHAVSDASVRKRIAQISWMVLKGDHDTTVWMDPTDSDPRVLQRLR